LPPLPQHHRSGKDFTNPCRARCEGFENFSSGPCVFNNAATNPAAPQAAAAAAPTPGKAPVPMCTCPSIWRPVCASADGGKTYQTFVNDCSAKCAGAVVRSQGECASIVVKDENQDGKDDAPEAAKKMSGAGPQEVPAATPSVPPTACPCPRLYRPVCATVSADGRRQQFANACEAKCVGGKQLKDGPCPAAAAPAAATPAAAAPAAAKTTVKAGTPVTYTSTGAPSPNRPGPECSCPLVYTPVCGADKRTWGSACAAGCAGVKVAAEGECGKQAAAVDAAAAKPAAAAAAAAAPGKQQQQPAGKPAQGSPTKARRLI
jgi:hypothetical protein